MTDLETEVIYSGTGAEFTREWLHNHQIVIFKAKGNYTRDLVEAWGKSVIKTVQEWPLDKAYYAIHDNSDAKNAYTPMAREWIQKITEASKDIHGYYALVADNGLVSRIFKFMIESQLRQQLPKLQSKVFFKREDAVKWLEDNLAKENSKVKTA